MQINHWQIKFSTSRSSLDEETLGLLCCEAGALGAVSSAAGQLQCFVHSEDPECQNFINSVSELGLSLIEISKVEDQNWVQNYSGLWQVVEAGEWRVYPIAAAENCPTELADKSIYIIPGTGFGTGQHYTTRMIITALQEPALQKLRPQRILDLGTGSGILAIAAKKIFNSPVQAIDNDQLALNNAAENIELNGCSNGIELKLGSITAASGKFPLILANLYAELLCEFSSGLTDLAEKNSYLIVSGILENLQNDVLAAFAENWQTEAIWNSRDQYNSAETPVWTAIIFKKK